MTWFREWLRGDGPARVDGDGAGEATGSAGRASSGPRVAQRPGTGLGRAVPGAEQPDAGPTPAYPGERLGLPETGPGSVATLARRGAQFVLDAVLAGLVASLFTLPAAPQNWSLLSWAVLMVVPVALFGASPAMVMLGLRVVRLDRPGTPGVGPLWALVRTASVFFIVPALIVDRDGRGVHDRASRTMVLRTR